jgi:hypothetical protein
MNAATTRYELGNYDFDFGDDEWKAKQMMKVISKISDPSSIHSFADVGCGNGGTSVQIVKLLKERGFPVRCAAGYDLASAWKSTAQTHTEVAFRCADFTQQETVFDLVTLNDVIEHVLCPIEFCRAVAQRARYVALHIPLDNRLATYVSKDWNRRLSEIGHISFWNVASALTTLTAAGLFPLYCILTPGFSAPSGRKRLAQRLFLPIRAIAYAASPDLTALTFGGVSLAVLSKGLI